MDELDQTTNLSPKDILFDHEGLLLLLGGDYANGICSFSQRLEQFPEDTYALSMVGMIHAHLDQYDEALKYLEKPIELEPANPQYHDQVGFVYQKRGNFLRAIDYFEKAIQLDSERLQTLCRLLNCYLQTGKKKKLLRCCEQVLKQQPDDQEALLILARLSFLDKKYLKAIIYYKELLSSNPNEHSFWFNLARCYAQVQNFEEAYSSFKRAISLNQENGNYWLHLGVLLLENNQKEQGIQTLEKAQMLAPHNDKIQQLLDEQKDTQTFYDQPVFIDGNNVAIINKGEKPQIARILLIYDKLLEKGFTKIHFIVKANLWRNIDDPAQFDQLIKQKIVIQAPFGVDDDKLVLKYALDEQGLVLSNDKFAEYKTEKAITDYLWEKQIRFSIIGDSVQFIMNNDKFL